MSGIESFTLYYAVGRVRLKCSFSMSIDNYINFQFFLLYRFVIRVCVSFWNLCKSNKKAKLKVNTISVCLERAHSHTHKYIQMYTCIQINTCIHAIKYVYAPMNLHLNSHSYICTYTYPETYISIFPMYCQGTRDHSSDCSWQCCCCCCCCSCYSECCCHIAETFWAKQN